MIDNKACIVVDNKITLKILEFILNSIEKVKHGFLLSSIYMFSRWVRQKPNLTAFTFKIQVFSGILKTKIDQNSGILKTKIDQNSGILKTKIDQRWDAGTLWKWILAIFKCRNEVPKQLGLLNYGTLIMISSKAPEKEVPQGNVLEFFLLDTLKLHFEWKI